MELLEKVYTTLKNTKGGKNDTNIPALAKVDPSLYAISIYTVDGAIYNIGDYKTKFAVESTSKIFSLALALDKYGEAYVKKKIGSKTSHLPFNSISEVENSRTHESNPFSNAGAIATTALSYETPVSKFEKKIVDNMSRFAGKKLYVNKSIYNSEMSLSAHNFALAYLMKYYSRLDEDVRDSVDVYTRQCSVMVTSADLAVMAATLACGGVNPETNVRVVKQRNVGYILDQMDKNGLYDDDESAKFHREMDVPAKSGVSGTLLLVIPGVMGIGIISPPLNKYGNSFKGMKTAKLLLRALQP